MHGYVTCCLKRECDLLPETRINSSQAKVIEEKYNPLIEQYKLNPVTIPSRPTAFCDQKRSEEILSELKESQAGLLVLLGDIPIKQFLGRVAHIDYSSLQEYVDLFGYGNKSEVVINGQAINVLPLAHPRQIGALGSHRNSHFLLKMSIILLNMFVLTIKRHIFATCFS